MRREEVNLSELAGKIADMLGKRSLNDRRSSTSQKALLYKEMNIC